MKDNLPHGVRTASIDGGRQRAALVFLLAAATLLLENCTSNRPIDTGGPLPDIPTIRRIERELARSGCVGSPGNWQIQYRFSARSFNKVEFHGAKAGQYGIEAGSVIAPPLPDRAIDLTFDDLPVKTLWGEYFIAQRRFTLQFCQ